MTLVTHMGSSQFLHIILHPQIAHLIILLKLFLSGKQRAKVGNLIEFLEFGSVGLRFSEAALLSQGLQGLYGPLRRTLQGIILCL